ncbi:MAG: hypothetical protein IJ740_12990 [Ruminococcus sp.]|nr:hypothetical protein [Ruminococcus sp.]
METTTNLHSEIVGDKQIISYDRKIEKVNYHVKIVLNANGNGAEDIKRKLSALLENELKRQLS